MASFTVGDGDNGVVSEWHSRDKWVHEVHRLRCMDMLAMRSTSKMQLIKTKVFSKYSAHVIMFPVVVFTVELLRRDGAVYFGTSHTRGYF